MDTAKRSTSQRLRRWIMGVGSVTLVTLVASATLLHPKRATSCANACINNLRQLDAAINQYALEHGAKNGDTIRYPDDLTPYIKLNAKGQIPSCPDGGIYSVGKVGDAPVCSMGGSVKPAHILW